jgi:hypothetical protein
MDIHVNIERKDLVALNFYLLPRLRSNWITLAVLIVGIFTYIMVARHPATPFNIGVAAFASIAGGIAGLLGGFAFNVIRALLTVGSKSGVLGEHRYSISHVGLREVTDANDSLQKWSGVQDIIKLPRYILFRVNGYLFHVVPRRAFANEKQFLAFHAKACAFHVAS